MGKKTYSGPARPGSDLHDLFQSLDQDPRQDVVAAPTAQDPWDSHQVESPMSMRGRFTDARRALAYIQAGKGTITVRSKKTGTRFTYRIKTKESNEPSGARGNPVFVSVLTGENNTTDYTYLGQFFSLQLVYQHGRKSKINETAPSAKAFDWVYRKLMRHEMPDELEVWHEGTCGRCGRTLTVPESVHAGFGPECIQHMGGRR